MAETDSRILEYLEEGLFLYGVGKVQESIVRWRKVLELDPRNERAMDYIESAGGDVSQFRAKAGLPARGVSPAGATPIAPVMPAPAAAPAAAAAVSAPPPAARVAALPTPTVTAPPGPLDIGAFLEATGTAPPRSGSLPDAAPAAMPWEQPPSGTVTAAPTAGAIPVDTASTTVTGTVPSMLPPQGQPPPPVAAPVAPPAPTDLRAQLISEAGVLFQSRAFEQSLEVLERVAKEYPPVDDSLRAYIDAARNALYEVLKAQWPRPDLVPEIRMNASQVMQLKLSPEAGFIFSRVDGISNVEEILSMGGLDPFTTLRALSQLMRAGVIGVQG